MRLSRIATFLCLKWAALRLGLHRWFRPIVQQANVEPTQLGIVVDVLEDEDMEQPAILNQPGQPAQEPVAVEPCPLLKSMHGIVLE